MGYRNEKTRTKILLRPQETFIPKLMEALLKEMTLDSPKIVLISQNNVSKVIVMNHNDLDFKSMIFNGKELSSIPYKGTLNVDSRDDRGMIMQTKYDTEKELYYHEVHFPDYPKLSPPFLYMIPNEIVLLVEIYDSRCFALGLSLEFSEEKGHYACASKMADTHFGVIDYAEDIELVQNMGSHIVFTTIKEELIRVDNAHMNIA